MPEPARIGGCLIPLSMLIILTALTLLVLTIDYVASTEYYTQHMDSHLRFYFLLSSGGYGAVVSSSVVTLILFFMKRRFAMWFLRYTLVALWFSIVPYAVLHLVNARQHATFPGYDWLDHAYRVEYFDVLWWRYVILLPPYTVGTVLLVAYSVTSKRVKRTFVK